MIIHQAEGQLTTAVNEPRVPKSVPFIVSNELAERFSFYGMRSILSLFLVHHFFNPSGLASLNSVAEAKSNAYTHAFSSLLYFTPFLGALLADWFFGKYRVILIGSIIYTFGHFLLAISPGSLFGFTSGMMVIAFAAGSIKSCVVANVGDQFNHTNQHLMTRVYGWFYFSINLGGTISILLIPVLYKYYGPALAFGVPGILMALATIVFYSGNKQFVKVPPTGIKKDNLFSITFFVFKTYLANKPGTKKAWQLADEKFGTEKINGVKAIGRVMAVFAFIPIFWGMWDMSQSEWVIQADKLDLSLGFLGIKILAAQVQVANALFILAMIPIFNYGVYPLVRKMGIQITPLRKIGAGMFVTALSFVVIGILQTRIQGGHHPTILWQLLAYLLLSAAEVLVVITGIEYAYTQSPPSMKSTMTSIWWLTYSAGTFFTTLINVNIAQKGWFSNFTGDKYFYFFVGVMLLFFTLFLFISPIINEKSYLAGAENNTADRLDETKPLIN